MLVFIKYRYPVYIQRIPHLLHTNTFLYNTRIQLKDFSFFGCYI